jgi:hypothetical protein
MTTMTADVKDVTPATLFKKHKESHKVNGISTRDGTQENLTYVLATATGFALVFLSFSLSHPYNISQSSG